MLTTDIVPGDCYDRHAQHDRERVLIALPSNITFLGLVLLPLVILILGVIAAPSAHCCFLTGGAPCSKADRV